MARLTAGEYLECLRVMRLEMRERAHDIHESGFDAWCRWKEYERAGNTRKADFYHGLAQGLRMSERLAVSTGEYLDSIPEVAPTPVPEKSNALRLVGGTDAAGPTHPRPHEETP